MGRSKQQVKTLRNKIIATLKAALTPVIKLNARESGDGDEADDPEGVKRKLETTWDAFIYSLMHVTGADEDVEADSVCSAHP